jgi:hypothetical protein
VKLSAYRRLVWEGCEKLGEVFCVHCGGLVDRSTAWDVCHVGAPAAHGGDLVGVGHRTCNQRDNITFVIPLVARGNRLHDRHVGITGPGLSDNPLPGGRRSNVSKKLNGEVVPRLPRYGKHHQTMAAVHPKEFERQK